MSSPTPENLNDHDLDPEQVSILAEAERERLRIVRSLAELGFALPGSVTERYQRCGKQQCACHGNPPKLHGPYLQWSRAVKGKTVTKVLTPDQLRRYQPWFHDGRRLRELAHELNELSLTTIRNLEQWGR